MQSTEIALPPEEAASEQGIKAYLKKQLGIADSDQLYFSIQKRSIDARGRNVKIRLKVIYAINENLSLPEFPKRKLQNVVNAQPVAIIGCGPAGLFAALRLIELGLKPVIIERGKNVRDRRRDLAVINKKGIVNPDSNYCFGEGGAGTYSDGKLYTRSNKRGNVHNILNTFIEFGASPDIAVDAHPHIGTNKLPHIIERMREAILSCGGEILFNTRFEGFIITNGGVSGIKISNTAAYAMIDDKSSSEINASIIGKVALSSIQSVSSNLNVNLRIKSCILAAGHSARDIFEHLAKEKILIEAKPFALGVRIEHPQQIIDSVQYHCEVRSQFLPPSSYSMVNQSYGKGVYSFCMCPGGIIAPAATAPGEVVVNGWSPSRRNNPFANSGIVVSVDEKDFAKFNKFGALAALQYQRYTEQQSFKAGGGELKAPAQRMVDFVDHKTSASLPQCSYIPGVTSVNLLDVLPHEISLPLKESLKEFGKRMKGYLTNDAILVATESRTSSPVRIPRDSETLMHPQLQGLFPCAEGAGYAGGIVSAAIDGERCAEKVWEYIKGT